MLEAIPELEDESLSTSPTTTTGSISSDMSPGSLNFSRPRRTTPDVYINLRHHNDHTAGPSAPVQTWFELEGSIPESRDSIEEAVPPPIRTLPREADYASEMGRLTPTGPQKHGLKASQSWIHEACVSPSTSDFSSALSSNFTEGSSSIFENEDADDVADSDTTDQSVAATRNSSFSEFRFDGLLGWDPPQKTPIAKDHNQRWTGTRRPTVVKEDSTHSNSTQSSDSNKVAHDDSNATTGTNVVRFKPPVSSATGSLNDQDTVTTHPQIVKRVSLDQISEHINPWQGESMSDDGSMGSNEWSSSDVDTSVLSVEKIHKLKKKGINPALYVEMQNARKGKTKWVNPLGGSSFLM